MFYTNDHVDMNFMKDMGLSHMTVNMWTRKFSENSKYFYRVRFVGGNTEIDSYIPLYIIKLASTYENFNLLVDFSFEAYAYENFPVLHRFVKKYNLNKKVTFLIAHMNVDDEYKAWCSHNNEESLINVVYYNIMFSNTFYHFRDMEINFSPKKDSWFCCLNHRPHMHRLGAVTYLDYLDLLNKGIVTAHDKFYEDAHWVNDENNDYNKTMAYFKLRIDPRYETIISNQQAKTKIKLPLIYDNPNLANGCQPYMITPSIFNDCLINLVTETYYFNDFNFLSNKFLTEKTFKSILSKQIFIIIGPKGILKELKNMGFGTFGDYIDESYDDAPDDIRLFKAIESLNDAMNTYTIQQLDDLTRKIRIKNYKVYNKKDFNINLPKILGL